MVVLPKNTALRGSRYKDSFIPPKPAMPEVEADYIPASGFHGQANIEPPVQAPQVSQQISQPSQAATSSGLKLNPPKLPEKQNVPRSPSLFERITGSVQQHLDGMRDEQQPKERTAPSPGPLTGAVAPTYPSQGSLNIDTSAAAKPKKTGAEDELDIPAFLRRQAN